MRWTAEFQAVNDTSGVLEAVSKEVEAPSIDDAHVRLRREYTIKGDITLSLIDASPAVVQDMRCDHYWLYRRGGTCPYCREHFQGMNR